MSVSLRDVQKAFGAVRVLDRVSLEVGPREFVAVLGPSGCGKTTMLRAIAGLEPIDGGEIAIAGRTVAGDGVELTPEARGIGVVFQSYALWPHMTVEENVAFPLKVAGGAAGEVGRQVGVHLETVDLSAFRGRRPAELSGGQRQRVALARCLAQGAGTILMDEPLANLDPHLRAQMESELARFRQASAATIIYITHDQREAMALADRVAVMFEGRFAQVDTPERIYARPADERVTRFIGRSAILDGEFDGGAPGVGSGLAMARIAGLGAVPVTFAEAPEGRAVRVVVRPGDVAIGDGVGGVSGTVTETAYRGGTWEIAVAIADAREALPAATDRRVSVGETVPVAVHGGWVLPEASRAPGLSRATAGRPAADAVRAD